jgi:hypothetical protein
VRIRIVKLLNAEAFEPFDITRFEVGHVYDVGYRLAELLMVEGCAEPDPWSIDRVPDHPTEAP